MSNINVLSDDLISLPALARDLPTPPSAATQWRWHARGVNGSRLETILIGRRRFTTKKAFAEFVRQQSCPAQS